MKQTARNYFLKLEKRMDRYRNTLTVFFVLFFGYVVLSGVFFQFHKEEIILLHGKISDFNNHKHPELEFTFTGECIQNRTEVTTYAWIPEEFCKGECIEMVCTRESCIDEYCERKFCNGEYEQAINTACYKNCLINKTPELRNHTKVFCTKEMITKGVDYILTETK